MTAGAEAPSVGARFAYLHVTDAQSALSIPCSARGNLTCQGSAPLFDEFRCIACGTSHILLDLPDSPNLELPSSIDETRVSSAHIGERASLRGLPTILGAHLVNPSRLVQTAQNLRFS